MLVSCGNIGIRENVDMVGFVWFCRIFVDPQEFTDQLKSWVQPWQAIEMALTNWLSILSRFPGFHRTECASRKPTEETQNIWGLHEWMAIVSGCWRCSKEWSWSHFLKEKNQSDSRVLNENCIEDNIRQRSLDVSESHQWTWFCDDQRPHLRSGPQEKRRDFYCQKGSSRFETLENANKKMNI